MEGHLLRPPAVAGSFYPSNAYLLRQQIESCLAPVPEAAEVVERPLGVVVPHAGIMYSGHVAGAVYRRLGKHPVYIILGVNHRGRGVPLATICRGAWQTPLGQVEIETDLALALMKALPTLEDHAHSHATEHSLEVQLPFLQVTAPGFRMVPVAIGGLGFNQLEELGMALATVLGNWNGLAPIVASSDLNHYESDRVTRVKDAMAIERILALDAAGLYEVLERERISMCGYGPVVAMLTAAKTLGATQGTLVKHATSADAGGGTDAVVGYAGIIVT